MSLMATCWHARMLCNIFNHQVGALGVQIRQFGSTIFEHPIILSVACTCFGAIPAIQRPSDTNVQMYSDVSLVVYACYASKLCSVLLACGIPLCQ